MKEHPILRQLDPTKDAIQRARTAAILSALTGKGIGAIYDLLDIYTNVQRMRGKNKARRVLGLEVSATLLRIFHSRYPISPGRSRINRVG